MIRPLRRAWMVPLLRRSVRTQLRRGLAGVWVRGQPPAGGAVLAPNHPSWWDGYLLAELAWQQAQPVRVMMDTAQLATFPFLSLLGARSPGDLRALARDARTGAWVIVFPEGEIRPAGRPGDLHGGAGWLARTSGAPLCPVALRVMVRAAPTPEAFVRFGAPCRPAELPARLQALVEAQDAELAQARPDQPPAGYLCRVRGQSARPDQDTLPVRLLRRLGGWADPHGTMKP
ncbi:lysophospholipid acyltransferase family protein [Deinococcus hohokamensis]|uniref:Lysophospholipid acyltransferase family protein n=1 Tax=Deinococcus hohokamensis TaxID=309883 RepID=A0ABV9I8Z2_9DEIO